MTAPTTELGHASGGAGGWWAPPNDEDTPELQWPNSVRVFSAMRRQDARVSSVLRAVTMPVLRTPWRLKPAGARDEVVEQIAEDLGLPIVGEADDERPRSRTRDRFSWQQHLEWSLLDLTFGHMFFEQIGRLDERGRVRLRKLAPRMPRTIAAINVADDGGLVSIEQHPPAGAQWPTLAGTTRRRGLSRLGTIEIPVSRLVAYAHQREGGDWTGQSLLRPAYKHWLIKDRLMRVQALAIERNGMGIPVVTAPENASEAWIAQAEDLARSVRSGDDAGAALPFGAGLALKGVEGTIISALPDIRYHDEQIAGSVLAHLLNLGNQTGSWALGTTFADMFVSSLQGVAEAHREVAQSHVVEDLVDWNWGEDEPAPQLVFEEIGSRQPATAAALKALTDAGVILPDRSLEEAVRELLNLPPKDPIRQPNPTPAGDPADQTAGGSTP